MPDNRQHAESTALACDDLPSYTPPPLAAATAASGAYVKRHAGVKCMDRFYISIIFERCSYNVQVGVLHPPEYMIPYHYQERTAL